MAVHARARFLIWLSRFLLLMILVTGSFLAAWLRCASFQQSHSERELSHFTSTTSPCLRESFKDVVLVIVYNYPFYQSMPLLKKLYGSAFATIMFCGPKSDKDDPQNPVDHVYHKKGYFGYLCLARAMEKHSKEIQTDLKTEELLNSMTFSVNPQHNYFDYKGFLVINDDIMLNFWNFLNFGQSKIWEGPKVPVQYPGFVPRRKWYWWGSRWGMSQCQKAYNEIWSLRNELNLWDKLNVTESLEILAKNGRGQSYCYRGRSDVFYVPALFSEMFQLLAHIFYKHSVFLEIAVPTILRMLDLQENFEKIPGVYLPGRVNETFVKDSKYFWQVYDKSKYFVHPLKLNYADSEMSRAFLKTWVMDYVERITSC